MPKHVEQHEAQNPVELTDSQTVNSHYDNYEQCNDFAGREDVLQSGSPLDAYTIDQRQNHLIWQQRNEKIYLK
jgi:hypothetical protein